MSLKDTLQDDLHTSIRERDQVRTSTLRLTLAAFTNAEVSGKQARELDDKELLGIVTKEAKKRKESADIYADAGRPELAERERAELAVLEAYLPAQLDDAELDRIVAEAASEVGATGMAQMGQVMKAAQTKVAGRAEGGRVAAAVKRALAG